MNENDQYLFKSVSDIMSEIKKYPTHPFKIQRAVIDHLQYLMDGRIDHINATNPFTYDLETAAVLTSTFCSYDNDLNRKQYPAAALTQEDLYLHMCDKDFIGRFSLPAKGLFTFFLNVNEIVSRMHYDPDIDARKVVFPRNSYVEVAGMTYTFEYPVEIRELPHGGLQLLMDTEIPSPIQILSTNMIEYEIDNLQQKFTNDRDMRWLKFDLELLQVKLNTYTYHTSRSEPFQTSITLEDYYYYARVFWQDNNSNWHEMVTTHSPDVYDIASPTAVLKVLKDRLVVTIPQIYIDRGFLDGGIRVDVYETKGELNVDLAGYEPDEFKITFRAIDAKRDQNVYTTSAGNLATLRCFSRDMVSGGRGPLTFTELRDRVIENSIGIRKIPISNIQIETHLEDHGFKIVKNIDVVTNRAYLAARSLPDPKDEKLLTPAAASVETLSSTLEKLTASGWTYDNHRSVTINPEAVYESKNGILRLLGKQEIDHINSLDVEERVKHINSRDLYRSPFHYVIDMEDRVYDLRTYYLDQPKADSKSFVAANDTTALLQVTITDYEITRTPKGYRLVIMTKSDHSFDKLPDDKVYVQLCYKPPREIEYAYINGKFIGREDDNRMFEFNIETNYNISKTHAMILTNFKMFNQDDRLVPCPLEQDFEIVFSTNEALVAGWRPSPIDKKLGEFMLPPNTKAVVNEKIKLTLGYNLEALWKRARQVVSPDLYTKYDQDEIATYEKDIPYIDPVSGTSVSITSSGEIEYKYAHRKGDIIYDDNGEVVYKHRKGDLKMGMDGLPLIEDQRKIVLQLDIMMIEWAYFVADHPVITNYRENMFRLYVDWIIDSLKEINDNVLEQTKVYFYPRATLGAVEVMVNDGIPRRVNAAQRLNLSLVVRPQVYANLELREQISKATVKVLNKSINNGLVSTSDILSNLVNEYGYDVIGVELYGLGGDDRIITMSILDESKRLSIKKRLVMEANQKLFVEEDVNITFLNHEENLYLK